MCQARVSETSRDVFPSVGILRSSIMREIRGMSVLVCLFCHFLNIALGRIGSILSGVYVSK